VSRNDLRDVSERLTGASDTEGVVFEFLTYLQSVHSDWRGALAFYEISQDCLVSVYDLKERRLGRRDVTMQVDQLPARLVRKFFHPNAFFNQAGPRPLMSQWLKSSPFYEPDAAEGPMLRLLIPIPNWQSCVCLGLADHDDVLALLVLASEKKKAFPPKAIEEIMPIKNVASLALAQHLHRASWSPEAEADADTVRQAAAEFQEHIRHLTKEAQELEDDNRVKTAKLATLAGEIEKLDRNSSEYKQELERVKGTVFALEEQTATATEHLSEAYGQLDTVQARLAQIEKTIGFVRGLCQELATEYDPGELPDHMVAGLAQHFGIERCSLMLIDDGGDTMHVASQHGMDPTVASRVKVRVGQGIAGWVAHHRKPLFVRVREDLPTISREVKETYNSDSFICVPVIHGGMVLGVLSLSNKRDGEPFEDVDVDRATIVASLIGFGLVFRMAVGETDGEAMAA
jgi:transcriptional regulator with GAF, ATPase, and Fis domain